MDSLVEYNLCSKNSVWQNLINDVANNRIAHAYLFSGPQGLGKLQTAKDYIKHIIKADKILSARIDKNDFTDLLYISKQDKSEITIDSIRASHDFFNQTAAEGKDKFVIIDEAERLNLNASNALLKILEEPKPNTYIFLIANSAYKLLATIRSRCRIIKFLPEESLRIAPQYLEIENFIAGSPGRIALCEELDVLSLYHKLNDVIQSSNILEFNKLSNNLGKNDKQWNLVKDLLIYIVSENAKKSNEPKSWISVFDYLNKTFQDADIYNLDRKQVLLIALEEIRSDRNIC